MGDMQDKVEDIKDKAHELKGEAKGRLKQKQIDNDIQDDTLQD